MINSRPITMCFSALSIQCVMALPIFGQFLTTTLYPVPTSSAYPREIVTGPDGALWFTEENGQKIGRMTTAGTVTEYSVTSAFPEDVTVGPDGALWFITTSSIGRITTGGVKSEYPLSAWGSRITSGPDGALWFTEPGRLRIGRMTPNGTLTEYTLPNANTAPNASNLNGITTGPDGALWFIDAWNNAIGRITTAGAITEFPVPTLKAAGSIVTGSDGALWFDDMASSSVGRITTGGTVSEYNVGFPPSGLATGGGGALWFASLNGKQIGSVTPSGAVTTYSVTTSPGGALEGLTIGPDGALWIADGHGNQIARVQIPSIASRSGVLSHIAAGGGWTTVIALVNNSLSSVPVTVSLYRDDGSALSLPVTIMQQGVSHAITTFSVTATINGKASLFITTGDGIPSTSVGWADVDSAGSLGGYAIFRQTPQNGSPSEGTVPLQTQFPSTITLPYDNSTGFSMGVALTNLATASANVTATVWDDSGNQLGTQSLTISGNGHTSFVLPTQIPLTVGGRGTVQFQSSGGLAGLGLRFSPFGTFTSVPTI